MSSFTVEVDKPDSCLHCKLRSCLTDNTGCYQICALQLPDYGFKREPFFTSADLVDGWVSPKCPLTESDDLSFVGVDLKAAVDCIFHDPDNNFQVSSMPEEARSGFYYGLSLVKTLLEAVSDIAQGSDYVVLTDDPNCVHYTTTDLRRKAKGGQQ